MGTVSARDGSEIVVMSEYLHAWSKAWKSAKRCKCAREREQRERERE